MLHSPTTMPTARRGTVRRLSVTAAAVLGTVLVPAATAAAQDPVLISPNTPFVGLVNGKTADAVVTVVCPGPIGPNSVGHPASGQTAEVRSVLPTVAPAGYTGSAGKEIVAGFNSASAVNQGIVFSAFFAPAAIPTTWYVPCSGSGAMTFVPEPTSPTARSYTVTVTFIDIAA